MIEVVRTEMPETAARARNRNPITWFRLAVLQRTVYGDTLKTRLSTFPVAMQWRETSNTHRAEERSRVFAFEVLGNRRDVSNIRNLIAPIMRHRQAKNRANHTTYWENVPSTVYPLSLALEQSVIHYTFRHQE